MKKLLFVLAFAFIGQQAFSQMYIVTTCLENLGNCSHSQNEITLLKVDPLGNETTVCIQNSVLNGGLGQITQELNSIINQGYKLIEITSPSLDGSGGHGGGLMESNNGHRIGLGTVWYFAIP